MALSKVGKNQVDQSAELSVDSDLTVDTTTLHVDSTNNRVGIGTASPLSDLSVESSTGGVLTLSTSDATGSSGDNLGKIDFYSGDTSTGSTGVQARISGVYDTNGDSTALTFTTGTSTGSGSPTISERMRIDSSGRVTMPYQPVLSLQPDTSSNVTTADANNHIVGWKTVSGRQTLLRAGLTLSGASGSTHIANGSNTGRITFSVGGVYYVDCTIRLENSPATGNLYMRFNDIITHRMHVEAWNRYNYAHGRISRCIAVSANDYVDFGVACSGGVFSGSNDTVNWLTIMKVA